MNLLLLSPSEISPEGLAVLTGPRAKHLLSVLKVKAGSVVRAGVIDGPIGSARVESIEGEHVRLRVELEGSSPPRPAIDLLLALPRPKVLKRLWAQLAALGVGTVVLTNAAKVERFYFDSHVVREAELRPYLLEGLAQAKDTRVPVVRVAKTLKPLVEDKLDAIFGDAQRLIADPIYDRSVFGAVRPGRVVLALGPEGGWSEYERALLERHGFEGVGLGPRTLRSDTAAVCLVAIVHEALRSEG